MESLADPMPASSAPANQGGDVESDDAYGPRAGDWEVTLAGAGNNDDDFNAGGAQLAGSVGYFFTDWLELVARQNVAFADGGTGQPDVWNASSRVALDVHIPIGPVVPYVGGNFGVVYGDSIDETFAAAPEAGVKWYVVENAFLQASGEYQFFFDDADGIDEGFDNGSFVYGLGIGLRF